jgi:hypothetical protein
MHLLGFLAGASLLLAQADTPQSPDGPNGTAEKTEPPTIEELAQSGELTLSTILKRSRTSESPIEPLPPLAQTRIAAAYEGLAPTERLAIRRAARERWNAAFTEEEREAALAEAARSYAELSPSERRALRARRLREWEEQQQGEAAAETGFDRLNEGQRLALIMEVWPIVSPMTAPERQRRGDGQGEGTDDTTPVRNDVLTPQQRDDGGF